MFVIDIRHAVGFKLEENPIFNIFFDCCLKCLNCHKAEILSAFHCEDYFAKTNEVEVVVTLKFFQFITLTFLLLLG